MWVVRQCLWSDQHVHFNVYIGKSSHELVGSALSHNLRDNAVTHHTRALELLRATFDIV